MTCIKCGTDLEPGPRGRPPRYCGEVCRRAAEYELRRIQRRLERMEDEARRYRPGRSTYPHAVPADVAARAHATMLRDIEAEEARLRELLAAQVEG